MGHHKHLVNKVHNYLNSKHDGNRRTTLCLYVGTRQATNNKYKQTNYYYVQNTGIDPVAKVKEQQS